MEEPVELIRVKVPLINVDRMPKEGEAPRMIWHYPSYQFTDWLMQYAYHTFAFTIIDSRFDLTLTLFRAHENYRVWIRFDDKKTIHNLPLPINRDPSIASGTAKELADYFMEGLVEERLKAEGKNGTGIISERLLSDIHAEKSTSDNGRLRIQSAVFADDSPPKA